MNRNRFVAATLLTFLLVGCQVFTPTPEPATRVETVKAFPSADSVRTADSFILVSDLDDTVKITNVLNKEEMYNKGWYSELVFARVSDILCK